MERADEMLEDARLLVRSDRRGSAVNRAYYACFHMVSALLLTQGRYAKRHTGVSSLFQEHWIKSGKLPKKLGADYNNLLKRRHEADYGKGIFTKEEADTWLSDAEQLVQQVRDEIFRQIERLDPR